MITDSFYLKTSNKENSSKYFSITQLSNISHKIINEALNSGSDYLQDQMKSIDLKIIQYQYNIKQRIIALINESTTSLDNQKKLQDLRIQESTYNLSIYKQYQRV